MFQVQRRRQEHFEAQAAVNVSELQEQTIRRDELSKGASDSGKLLLEESRRQEEKFREEAVKRRREQEAMQKKQLLEIKQAENELMKKAQALKRGSSFSDAGQGISSSSAQGSGSGGEAETRWKKGFFASLFGRK